MNSARVSPRPAPLRADLLNRPKHTNRNTAPNLDSMDVTLCWIYPLERHIH